eukprot:TRINITY_DN6264_c0_g1_i1.p1 TRINITY_DN6264_c0_g1~~TRINITY_DN6264_c0_g1_i1.p1  ORF type:complete len:487 (-),score=122.81 TRINITY_DN6264_c0_g1_i1:96-1499(-)
MVRTKAEPRRSLPRTTYLPPPLTTPYPTIIFYRPQHVLKKRGRGGSGRGGDSRNRPSGVISSVVHPLAGFAEVPPLTDIQTLITEAILLTAPQSTFMRIYEHVNAKWRELNVLRRDGTPYTSDCKRAIRANLRYNPSHISLFQKSSDSSKFWTLCSSLEEARGAMKNGAEKELRKKEAAAHLLMGQGAARGSSNEKSTESAPSKKMERKAPAKTRRTRRGPSTRSVGSSDSHGETLVLPISSMTSLQNALTYFLLDSGSSPVGTIVAFAEYHAKQIKLGSAEKTLAIRQVVINCLSLKSKFSNLFMRDPANFLKWTVAYTHPFNTISDTEKAKRLSQLSQEFGTNSRMNKSTKASASSSSAVSAASNAAAGRRRKGGKGAANNGSNDKVKNENLVQKKDAMEVDAVPADNSKRKREGGEESSHTPAASEKTESDPAEMEERALKRRKKDEGGDDPMQIDEEAPTVKA